VNTTRVSSSAGVGGGVDDVRGRASVSSVCCGAGVSGMPPDIDRGLASCSPRVSGEVTGLTARGIRPIFRNMRMSWWMVAALASGCSTGANVKLSLSNQTVDTRARTAAPAGDGTELQLKILSIYLAEDVDPVTMDNVGNNAMIWIAPECGGEVDDCNVAGFTLPAGPRVTQYFDLARSSDEVNAELEADMTVVDAGSYRYARVEMCKAAGGQSQATVPTMLWAGPGIAEQSFTSGDCGRTSLAFDPPLTIAAGDTVGVTLGYDLSQAIVSGAPTGSFSLAGHADPDGTPHVYRACADADASHRVCMDFPDFAPSAALL
jgi:hypothetical protein